MITKIAASLLTVSLLAACGTTNTAANKRTTLREMYATNSNATSNLNEPPSPAEGPEDVPGEGPGDLNRNPALVPSPLLRVNAAGSP